MDVIKAFREETGATYPILLGVSEETKTAYGVTGYPTVKVLHLDGSIAGDGEETLDKCIEGT